LHTNDRVAVIRAVVAMLEHCTDCEGPTAAYGQSEERFAHVVRPRSPGSGGDSTLAMLPDLVAELDHSDRRDPIELKFEFLLREPGTVVLLPYRELIPSNLFFNVGRSDHPAMWFALWWPLGETDERFLESHDAIFERLQIVPDAADWLRGDAGPREFHRAAHLEPPTEEPGRSLHVQLLATPNDRGLRIAYADCSWSSSSSPSSLRTIRARKRCAFARSSSPIRTAIGGRASS
jgi:hypothetical protein